MATTKSYAEYVLGTLDALLVDCASQYPELTRELRRDYLRLSSAIKEHGVRFVLDVMPAYRKHFDKCLDEQRLTASGLLHFGVVKKHWTIPRLFRGLILRVFDQDGSLKTDPDIDAIRWIRQLLGACRKFRMSSEFKDVAMTVDEFYQIDHEVEEPSLDWDDYSVFQAQDPSSLSFNDRNTFPDPREPSLFDDLRVVILDPKLTDLIQRTADIITSQLGAFAPQEWRFRHGPGAVSDTPFGEYKYSFKTWPERLESVFPYADFAVANYACVDTSDPKSKLSSPFLAETPARLCAVPKTLSKPRLIACEPTSFQWAQQSIRDYFYKRVSQTFISRFVDFSDQDSNGRAALLASMDGSCATIDLSSASDRISCWAIERLFRRSPSLLTALQATRSQYVKQDICGSSPKLHKLRKYSTMGNATTFPVQSIFFLTLTIASVLYVRQQCASIKNIRLIKGTEVRVFGDDIVIPSDCSGVLREVLQALGLKVNDSKSFSVGNFRESCGVDAFAGVDVTTVNVLDFPERTRPGSIVSSVDVHNNLCDRGYFATARYIQKTVEQEVSYDIRTVDYGSGSFGWSSLGHPGRIRPNRTRYNQDLHRREARVATLRVSQPRLPPKDAAGLLQFFTEVQRVVTTAVSAIGYTAKRPKVSLRLGWVPC